MTDSSAYLPETRERGRESSRMRVVFGLASGIAGAVLLLLLTDICGAAQSSATAPPQAAGYKLAFQDDFRSLDLSPDGAGKHTWYANVWFNHKRRPIENIRASGQGLSLTWQDGQESNDTSITTTSPDGRNFHAWRYGYFEVRMKWDVVEGAWPAIWLIPEQGARHEDIYDGKEDAGEIDIFEGQGNHPNAYYGTIHHWVNGNQHVESNGFSGGNNFQLPPGVDLSAYHTYGMLWEPGRITWYFDNRPLHSEKTYQIFDKQDYFLVLGMQEGSDWKEGNRSKLKTHAMTMNVDWVRVWQR